MPVDDTDLKFLEVAWFYYAMVGGFSSCLKYVRIYGKLYPYSYGVNILRNYCQIHIPA